MVLHVLIDKDLADKAPSMGKIGRPQEIKPLHRLRIEVHPDLVGPRQGGSCFLHDLSCCINQLQEETSRLIAIKLEEQPDWDRSDN